MSPAMTCRSSSSALPEPWASSAAARRLVVLRAAVVEAMEQGASAARQRGRGGAWSSHAGVGVVTAVLASRGAPPEPGPIASVLQDWRALARAGGGHATLDWAPLGVQAAGRAWDGAGAAGPTMQR